MWEIIPDQYSHSWRMSVPNGWIVRSIHSMGYDGGCAVHHIFVEDPDHEWVLEDKS